MFIPPLSEAKEFARQCFRNLSTADGLIRFRLCEMVERSVVATADDEDCDILRVSAYLQEVGVIHSSRQKPLYSLQMCQHTFEESSGEELHSTLVDCIQNHVRSGLARTPEARLMQICHKYAVTHYLDYMLLKARISEASFEKLQMERIEAYSEYLRDHPRSTLIERQLQKLFHPIR